METPYRNKQLLEDLLKTLHPATDLCIATDVTLPSELIQTKAIEEWRKNSLPNIHKRPTMFLIYRS